ncbi:NUDIX domain-containing protein [Pantoea ananatis]|uniref:NUDIX domain-containing protein n=1 Tax=Pantoea ananas TaxID=553 RepID=UPI00051D021C|nr:NUDIX hydrolase [Pantoea ananatis]KGL57399.1 hypothetical protein KR94_05535 [Pantoea ananatis]MCW0332922.1 hypothetical protein [Pantoea ananatis]
MAESSVFNFSGCKLALLYNDQVLVIRRDNDPSILFSGMLDVTGGTREGNESPSECAFREAREETGLTLTTECILWMRQYDGTGPEEPDGFFIVGRLEKNHTGLLRLGNEGQYLRMMDLQDFMRSEEVIPFVRNRLNDYLASRR